MGEIVLTLDYIMVANLPPWSHSCVSCNSAKLPSWYYERMILQNRDTFGRENTTVAPSRRVHLHVTLTQLPGCQQQPPHEITKDMNKWMIYDLELPAILTSFIMCERRKVKYDVLMSENTAFFKQNTVPFSVSDKIVKCLCVVAVIVAEILHFVISCTMWCIS